MGHIAVIVRATSAIVREYLQGIAGISERIVDAGQDAPRFVTAYPLEEDNR